LGCPAVSITIERTTTCSGQTPQISIVGTPISLISLNQLLQTFDGWVAKSQDRYVVFRDVHGVIAARSNPRLDLAHKKADIVAPDGMPLVWTLRALGVGAITRLCGPDVLPAVCEYGLSRGWRHYFYGGAPGVVERLTGVLVRKYPGLQIAGTQCPPFRRLSPEENEIACSAIRAARPDFVWVGLGTPKQEVWMFEHRGQCGGAVMLGVGAAFDFHANLVRRAPIWMQRAGLEWAYRLVGDPKRLWRRYLVMAPIFVILAARELIRTKWRWLSNGRFGCEQPRAHGSKPEDSIR
jgi:N-acetylglucosaminyldiphosphoundecaprenol N-acetyl-beta-D-mannosaminyltransferase